MIFKLLLVLLLRELISLVFHGVRNIVANVCVLLFTCDAGR